MGTRNLTMVLVDNEIKVSQYCQWDGYPTGQGQGVVSFIMDELDLDKFKNKISKVKQADDGYIKELYNSLGADPESDMVSMDISDKFKEKYPRFHRNHGSNILKTIQDSDDGLTINISKEFIKDSLFCEWAYLLDLDNNTLEVYQGYQKNAIDKSERFYFDGAQNEDGYYPCKMIKKYDFSELSKESMSNLEDSLDEDED